MEKFEDVVKQEIALDVSNQVIDGIPSIDWDYIANNNL